MFNIKMLVDYDVWIVSDHGKTVRRGIISAKIPFSPEINIGEYFQQETRRLYGEDASGINIGIRSNENGTS